MPFVLKHREPNKRLVERVARDMLVHDVVGSSVSSARSTVAIRDYPAKARLLSERRKTPSSFPSRLASHRQFGRRRLEPYSCIVHNISIRCLFQVTRFVRKARWRSSRLHSVGDEEVRNARVAFHRASGLSDRRQAFDSHLRRGLASCPPSRAEHLDRSSDGHPPWLTACSKNRVATAGGEPPEKKGRGARRNINKKEGSTWQQE